MESQDPDIVERDKKRERKRALSANTNKIIISPKPNLKKGKRIQALNKSKF